MNHSAHFDPAGPLPELRLAIEASAGTGKTFALSTLAARYVTEAGIGIGELLVVTFTRAAAAELKDRVRSRLVEFSDVLADSAVPDDPVLAMVHSTDRELRRQRAVRALAEFDAATITTIHGFAQQVLGTLGSSVPTDPDAMLIDDASTLVAQVVADRLATEAVGDRYGLDLLPSASDLSWGIETALGNPDAILIPSTDPDESSPAAALLRQLVDELITDVAARRRQASTLSFDDLLVRLRHALSDPAAGHAARAALRRRFKVALIDEFQDTDPVQWGIFDMVFGCAATAPDDTASAMVLVGDPKQAIYAFRGANVQTYLLAARAPGTEQRNLDTNWRSDASALEAIDALLTGTTFGDDDIAFHPVQAAPAHRDRSICADDGTPLPSLSLRLMIGPRLLDRDKSATATTVDAGTAAVFADLAVYLRDLLDTAYIPDERGPGTRRLLPQDIAVLIGANSQGPDIRDALGRLHIPAVIARGENVLTSIAAMHWHWLLTALATPSDPRRARAAALSWFFGWEFDQVRATDDLSEVQELLVAWADVLTTKGIAAFVGTLRAESDVIARVLGRPDGERNVTDFDHLAELLTLTTPRFASPSTVLSTFESLAGGAADGDADADLSARRVESEASAVQIMTTFVAKGLEFGVVCCPTQWHERGSKIEFMGRKQIIYWDDAMQRRTVDVASHLPWPDEEAQNERIHRATADAIGSDLRVLYVALTRARHHTAVWWVPTKNNHKAALTRVLFGRDDSGRINRDLFTASAVTCPAPDEVIDVLAPLVTESAGHLETVVVDAPDPRGPRPRAWSSSALDDNRPLEVAVLGRQLPRSAGRWSFTSVTSRARDDLADLFDPYDGSQGDAGAADEQLTEALRAMASDEPDDVDGRTGDRTSDRADATATPVPLSDIAGGAGFGILVHEVLERVDFAATDLEHQLDAAVRERLEWNPWPVDPHQLVEGLQAVVHSPLGPCFDGRTLAQLSRADRVDELAFDLRLATDHRAATDAALGAVLLRHIAPDDPLRAWAERLATGPFSATLAGHLTGSIDLLARVRSADGTQPDRYVVVDYKTNRVAPRDTLPTSAHFTASSLTHEMTEADYPLQALLYSVAVHRYLRWRVAGYEPELHLGGIAYLFVRGMQGPSTPVHDGAPNGVFAWSPPAAMIRELSDLLDGHPAQQDAEAP